MTNPTSSTLQSANDLEAAEDKAFREAVEAAIADLFRAPQSQSDLVSLRGIGPDEEVPFKHRYPQSPPRVRLCESCGDYRFYPS